MLLFIYTERESKGMPELNFKNRTLYHGDNLDFLRGMNSETVHLIATDPPFNKNRDFHATPDSLAKGASFKDRWSWERDVHEEWTDSIIDDWPDVWEVITAARAAYGDDMGAFLCWLGVRLMEMHRVLRQDGSIYLHCDSTASHYIKAIMDAIFGWKNFFNEITWKRYAVHSLSENGFDNVVDHIFFYAKDYKNVSFRKIYGEVDEDTLSSRFPHIEPETGRRFQHIALEQSSNQSSAGEIRSIQGRTVISKIGWRWTQETFDERLSHNPLLIYWTKNGRPRYKKYADEYAGTPLGNIWADIKYLAAGDAERTGYPTQKPLALYERIIKASSNEGDIVLDPFCGCATTTIAAERLRRQWVGMDIWDEAHPVTLKRLAEEGMVTADSEHKQMFPHIVHYETAPPVRTDDNEMAAPTLDLRIQRPVEPWQRLTHKQMVRVLAFAQKSDGGVICAGCGRVLEVEFMQLDHITPKADRGENHIMNRILLCGPCNRRKRDNLTLRGLLRENRKKAVGWMKDEDLAKLVQEHAREKAEWVRDHFDSGECQSLIKGGISSHLTA